MVGGSHEGKDVRFGGSRKYNHEKGEEYLSRNKKGRKEEVRDQIVKAKGKPGYFITPITVQEEGGGKTRFIVQSSQKSRGPER